MTSMAAGEQRNLRDPTQQGPVCGWHGQIGGAERADERVGESKNGNGQDFLRLAH
jgi:hypothetical protein